MNTPNGYPFENGDSINIRLYNSVSGATFTMVARYYLQNGHEVVMKKSYAPTSTGAVNDYYEPMSKATLVSLQVSVASGTVSRGHCWVEVRHQRGLDTQGYCVNVLLNGYPSSASSISYPQNVLIEPGSGAGVTGAARFTFGSSGVLNGILAVVPVAKQFIQILAIRCDCNVDATNNTNRYLSVVVLPNADSNAEIMFPASTPFNGATFPAGGFTAQFADFAVREMRPFDVSPPWELIPAPMKSLEFAGATTNQVLATIVPIVGTDQVYAMEIIYRSWVAP